MIFIDNNEITINPNERPQQQLDKTESKKIQFSSDDDVDMILVYRSLYLLKRKFEVYEKEINKIYLSFKELDKLNLIIEKGKFVDVVRSVFKECNFSFVEIGKPNELYRAELVSQINEDKMKIILDLFNAFMNENREKYNEILKQKKIKSFDKLNKFEEDNQFNEEGATRIVVQNEDMMQTLNDDDDQKFDNLAKSYLGEDLKEKLDDQEKSKMDDNSNEIDNLKTEDIKDVNKVGNQEKEVKADNLNDNSNNDDNPDVLKEKQLIMIENRIVKELTSDYKEPYVGKSDVSIKVTWSDNELRLKTSKRDYLLIEALPLIIADFISENQNIVLVDFNEDLRDELRTLFDNEILQRLGEEIKHDINLEKEAKLKDLLFERLNLDNNIKTYENILVEKGSKRENTIFIENMLHKLREQKNLLSKKIKNLQDDNDTQNNYTTLMIQNESKVNTTQLPKKKGNNIFILALTIEDIKHLALKEIFYFYSRQHQYMRKELKGTFDSIRDKHEHLDLGEFMKFCIEFKILVKKEALMESFKKTAENTRELTFDKFVVILTSVASKMNDDKIKLLLKRLKKSKADLNVLYEKNMKKLNKSGGEKTFENSDDSVAEIKDIEPIELPEKSNKILDLIQSENTKVNNLIDPIKPSGPGELSKNTKKPRKYSPINLIELEKEVEQMEQTVKDLKAKSLDTLLEELYLYIGLDNESTYRKKMKGFLLPFSSEPKQYRIPHDVLMKKVKKLDPRTAEDIKKILVERKDERIKDKEEKERLQKLWDFEQRKKLNKMNKHTAKPSEDGNKNYTKIAHQHENFEKEKESKITWDQLEQLKFDHFITNRDDDFNPNELIDFDYDSDDEDIFKSPKEEKAKEGKIYNYNNVAILSDLNKSIHENSLVNESQAFLDKPKHIEKKSYSETRIANKYPEIKQIDKLNESIGTKKHTQEKYEEKYEQQKHPIKIISSTRIIPDTKKVIKHDKIKKTTEQKAMEADQIRLENAIKVIFDLILAVT
jgi:hypothetical protein